MLLFKNKEQYHMIDYVWNFNRITLKLLYITTHMSKTCMKVLHVLPSLLKMCT